MPDSVTDGTPAGKLDHDENIVATVGPASSLGGAVPVSYHTLSA